MRFKELRGLLSADGTRKRHHSLCAIVALCALAIVSCTQRTGWTSTERSLIEAGIKAQTADSLRHAPLRVLTVEDATDLAILRDSCRFLLPSELTSSLFSDLSRLMIATVSAPEEDGVGIAAPQVGISRRVIAVQRLDKEGEPFAIYPNIRIIAVRGDKVEGQEGCLSVPGKRGTVARWRDIDISYTLVPSSGVPRDTTETVKGFTSVIFQHECDHLDGVLYTDRASSVTEEEE